MAWWEITLLVFLLVADGSVVFDLWHDFGCPVCRAAKRAVQARHPDWRQVSTGWQSHRAAEPDRYIIAVFYVPPPPTVVMPPPYQLVAVCRNLADVEEVQDDDSSPYFIRGRK